MTREEFRANLIKAEWEDYIVALVMVESEPLFEEIEKLEESEEDKIEIIKDLDGCLLRAENDRTYWFDRYNLERATNIRLKTRIKELEEEIIRLQTNKENQ